MTGGSWALFGSCGRGITSIAVVLGQDLEIQQGGSVRVNIVAAQTDQMRFASRRIGQQGNALGGPREDGR